MSKWKYIDEYDSLPASDVIECDTRDFNLLCTEDRDAVNRIIKEVRQQIGYGTLSDCKFRRDEILGFLKSLEQATGGKREWKCVTIGSNGYWAKYIRFLKTSEVVDLVGCKEPVYIAVASDSSYSKNYVPISRTFIDENFDIDSLNFIKV